MVCCIPSVLLSLAGCQFHILILFYQIFRELRISFLIESVPLTITFHLKIGQLFSFNYTIIKDNSNYNLFCSIEILHHYKQQHLTHEFMIEICKIAMKFCRFFQIPLFQLPLLGPPRIRATRMKSAQI